MRVILTAVIAGIWLMASPITAQPHFYSLDKKRTGGYLASVPEEPARGLVLLIPRPGQDPGTVFPDSATTALAHANGIALVAVPHPGSYLLTPAIQRHLTEVLRNACKRFEVASGSIALGGMGEGGVLSLQFAEECWAAPALYPFRPRAVFCIDSPVDLVAWWRSSEKDLERNISPEAMAEARVAMRTLSLELGGSPDSLLQNYSRRSPFSMGGERPGKEQFLLETGLRLYYHDDLSFQLQERGRTIYDLPISPASVMIERLLRQGHTDATLQQLPEGNSADWVYWLIESLPPAGNE